MAINDVLSSRIGLSEILPPAVEENHLPKAEDYVAGEVNQVSLEGLFGSDRQLAEQRSALLPKLDRPEQLSPVQIRRSLESIGGKLSQLQDAHCRVFLRDVMQPLMEDTELLTSYTNMMIGG
ncbi:MAG: hypothetical protein IJ228_10725 [Succinivibrio sp.]|nr:hypothetical protein [Succinivibrio sp.]